MMVQSHVLTKAFNILYSKFPIWIMTCSEGLNFCSFINHSQRSLNSYFLLYFTFRYLHRSEDVGELRIVTLNYTYEPIEEGNPITFRLEDYCDNI